MKAIFEIPPHFMSVIDVAHAGEFYTLAIHESLGYDDNIRTNRKMVFELQNGIYMNIDGQTQYLPKYYLHHIE